MSKNRYPMERSPREIPRTNLLEKTFYDTYYCQESVTVSGVCFSLGAKLDSKLGELVLGALLLLLLKEASRSVTLCIWVLCPLCLKVIGHRSAAPGGFAGPYIYLNSTTLCSSLSLVF